MIFLKLRKSDFLKLRIPVFLNLRIRFVSTRKLHFCSNEKCRVFSEKRSSGIPRPRNVGARRLRRSADLELRLPGSLRLGGFDLFEKMPSSRPAFKGSAKPQVPNDACSATWKAYRRVLTNPCCMVQDLRKGSKAALLMVQHTAIPAAAAFL